jgi:hypothetical protein
MICRFGRIDGPLRRDTQALPPRSGDSKVSGPQKERPLTHPRAMKTQARL